MDPRNVRPSVGAVVAVATRQHGVITLGQLVGLGLSVHAVKYRVARRRLFVIYPRVYSLGIPYLTQEGRWMAAVLACGEGAMLSHRSAGELWGIVDASGGPIEVSVPAARNPRARDVRVHRRAPIVSADESSRAGIPVSSIVSTLIDLATVLDRDELEATINTADRLNRANPEALRGALERCGGRPGVAILRETLDRRTFTLTDSQLERRLIPIARRAGLVKPLTQQWLNGYRVDFYWPELGLVVETDGLRYHRTAFQQAVDRRRDQAHTAAGLTALRFTHAQVAREPAHVEAIFRRTARMLRRRVS